MRTFNKLVLNRLTRKIAHTFWGPFCIIYHVGRRSGQPYETPIIAIPEGNGFIIALTYGPDVDWYRNVLAAGKCRILWHRHEYPIVTIENMDIQTALPYFSGPERKVLRFVGTEHFVRMDYRVSTPA